MERKEGSLAVLVREGKGCKQRLVPYGALEGALVYVDAWLTNAGIKSGAVFRGFYKDNKTVRPTALTPRALLNILGEYPLSIDGQTVTVRPHDLRRTYARRLHDAGMAIAAIQQNLGHADMKTTLGYIGDLAAEQRKPPAVYRLNLARLSQAKGA
jgi:integrase